MAKPFEVTDQTFEDVVLKAELPTVVDFWAVWCGPCKMIAPVLEEISQEYDGQLQVAKLDVDHNNDSAFKYGVMSIPTLILFKNGEELKRFVGLQQQDQLVSAIEDAT